MENGIHALKASGYTGYTLFPQNRCALPTLLLHYADAIGYIPNIAQSDTTLLGLRQLIFMALRSCRHYRSTNDGLISSRTTFRFLLSRIAQRKKTGNQIVATNNKQSIYRKY